MLLDAFETFDPPGTALTTTTTSTNVLDKGAGRDLGIGLFKGKVLVIATTTFAAAGNAILNIQLQGAANNAGSPGPYFLLNETGSIGVGLLAAGTKLAEFDIPSITENPAPVTSTTATITNSSTSMIVTSATGIAYGQFINMAGVTPGTTVASISGTTVTMSNAATATVSVAASVGFNNGPPLPRFLQLKYVISTGPFTAGAIAAYLAGDVAQIPYYAPGFTQNY